MLNFSSKQSNYDTINSRTMIKKVPQMNEFKLSNSYHYFQPHAWMNGVLDQHQPIPQFYLL